MLRQVALQVPHAANVSCFNGNVYGVFRPVWYTASASFSALKTIPSEAFSEPAAAEDHQHELCALKTLSQNSLQFAFLTCADSPMMLKL
jgi:hypothetical protein